VRLTTTDMALSGAECCGPNTDEAYVAAETAAESAAAKLATATALQAAAATVVREDGPDAPFTAAMRAEATGEPVKKAGLFGT
jgi:hypothetical protein